MRIKTGTCEVYARARGCETAYALAELANSLHDQALVGSPDSAPDGRRVYKLWDDGEITYEKGGCAYGRREHAHGRYVPAPVRARVLRMQAQKQLRLHRLVCDLFRSARGSAHVRRSCRPGPAEARRLAAREQRRRPAAGLFDG